MIFSRVTSRLSGLYYVGLLFGVFGAQLTKLAGAVNDLNPSLRLGDEGIDNVLRALQSIQQRALSKIFPCYPLLSDLLIRTQHVELAYSHSTPR